MAVKHLSFSGKSAQIMPKVKRVKKYFPTHNEATPMRATLNTGSSGGGRSVSSGGGRTADGTKYGAKTYGAGLGISKPATKKVGKVRGH